LEQKYFQSKSLDALIIDAFESVNSNKKAIEMFSNRPFTFRLGWYLIHLESQETAGEAPGEALAA